MAAALESPTIDFSSPLDLGDAAFARDRAGFYRALLEAGPVHDAKISVLKVKAVVGYEESRFLLTDDRFIRNRSRARGKKGGSSLPVPLPKAVAALTKSMIYEDDPEHLRHRTLVNKAFTTRAVTQLESRVEALCAERLAALEGAGEVDLLTSYARDVPTRVIAALMGIDDDEIQAFERSMRVLSDGLTGFSILRTMLWDLRGVAKFVRGLVARKREQPGEDLLSALIEVEEEGDRLSEDELVAMVFLLVVAGFETTVHQIANGTAALLDHPDQLARLRGGEASWETAADELVRFCGPVGGTKPNYPIEDVEIGGVLVPRGTPVMPLLGAANRDPKVFDDPDALDVSRDPNPHLGFGFGAHFCLGRPLALMETRTALRLLFERYPNLRAAAPPEPVSVPGWNRLGALRVELRD